MLLKVAGRNEEERDGRAEDFGIYSSRTEPFRSSCSHGHDPKHSLSEGVYRAARVSRRHAPPCMVERGEILCACWFLISPHFAKPRCFPVVPDQSHVNATTGDNFFHSSPDGNAGLSCRYSKTEALQELTEMLSGMCVVQASRSADLSRFVRDRWPGVSTQFESWGSDVVPVFRPRPNTTIIDRLPDRRDLPIHICFTHTLHVCISSFY